MKKINFKKCIKALFIACLLLGASFMVTTSAVETQAATNGFKKVSGKIYYYKNGKLYKNGWLKIGNKYYYMDKKTGAAKTGWVKNKEGARYFDKKTGVMYNMGWFKNKEGYRYFDKKTGVAKVGWVLNKEGYRYFDKKTGVMKMGWVLNKEGYRYFDKKTGVMKMGWVKNSEGHRFFNKKTGVMLMGLHKVQTNVYRFFDQKTGVMWTGLKKHNGHYYYMEPATGFRFQGGFKTISGKTYYFKGNGRAVVGWGTLGTKRYYFGSDGVMYANRTAKIGSETYKFDSKGVATKVTSSGSSSSDFAYTEVNGKLKVYDSKNKKYYYIAREYISHPGVANNKVSDRDLLAAICDAEANDQGVEGMAGVAMCILNRTLNKEFPSNMRWVIYDNTYGSYPQYSPVRDGALRRRLNGVWEEKTKAYQAADYALKEFKAYVNSNGKDKRVVPGFKAKDFNYQYFMTPGAFWAQPLDHSKYNKTNSETISVKTPWGYSSEHIFFVDWIS